MRSYQGWLPGMSIHPDISLAVVDTTEVVTPLSANELKSLEQVKKDYLDCRSAADTAYNRSVATYIEAHPVPAMQRPQNPGATVTAIVGAAISQAIAAAQGSGRDPKAWVASALGGFASYFLDDLSGWVNRMDAWLKDFRAFDDGVLRVHGDAIEECIAQENRDLAGRTL